MTAAVAMAIDIGAVGGERARKMTATVSAAQIVEMASNVNASIPKSRSSVLRSTMAASAMRRTHSLSLKPDHFKRGRRIVAQHSLAQTARRAKALRSTSEAAFMATVLARHDGMNLKTIESGAATGH